MSNHTMFINKKLEVSTEPPYDALQSFVRDNHIAIKSNVDGPLSSYVFAAKDVFRIKGSTWGNGHPDWLRFSEPDNFTSSAIINLINAGSSLVGKTVCDELCYSISGENWNYGSPLNPHDVRRLAGGSSSGSCTATAGGLVDFAIGSDCLGSVRVPASYNGLWGIRPTYQRVATDGEVEYCDSMDVLGFVANNAKVFEDVGEVLLKEDRKKFRFNKLLIATDCFNAIDTQVKEALLPVIEEMKAHFDEIIEKPISSNDLEDLAEVFRIVQGYEVWRSYKKFIQTHNPKLSPGPKGRLEFASKITDAQYKKAVETMLKIKQEILEVIGEDTLVILPTASSVAPLKTAQLEEINHYRAQSSKLLCISPLAGVPQITIPRVKMDNVPLGISVLGPEGSDLTMIKYLNEIFK